MAHKAPNRKNNDITQSFNDGIVKICSVTNSAEPGYQPVEKLKVKLIHRYSEQRLGINRLYLSRQNQAEIEKVLRVQKKDSISTQDIALLGGKQYRIDVIQNAADVYPPSLDLSLVKIVQDYEVEE